MKWVPNHGVLRFVTSVLISVLVSVRADTQVNWSPVTDGFPRTAAELNDFTVTTGHIRSPDCAVPRATRGAHAGGRDPGQRRLLEHVGPVDSALARRADLQADDTDAVVDAGAGRLGGLFGA